MISHSPKALMPMADIARALRNGTTPWPVLGEGMWGRVHDLGDGTVLKLARRTAGIGDGEEKLKRDIAVTHGLNAGGLADPAIPRPLAHGALPDGAFAEDGFCLWLRQSRLDGRPLSYADIEALDAQSQDQIARQIGTALARLQQGLSALNHTDIPANQPFAACEDLARGHEHWPKLVTRLKTLSARLGKGVAPSARLHGDFNLDNVLFDQDLRLVGIVDFAESRPGTGEGDLAKITRDLPMLAAPLIQSWEAETGRPYNPQALELATAHDLMISAMIQELRSNDKKGAAPARDRLIALMDKLEAHQA